MHHFNAHLSGIDDAPVEAQVVQAQLGASLGETLESVYNLRTDQRLRADMLIVRLPIEESCDHRALADLQSETARRYLGSDRAERDRTFARARDRSVHLLGSCEGDLFITPNLNPHWSSDPFDTYGLRPAEVLDAIRRDEFEYILDRSRAVLTLPPGSHYLAPSRRPVQSFIRVGNIQYSRDAIEAVTFWLLPHLQGVGAILTDTWSISSIAFSVAGLASAYFGVPPLRVEMLPNYNDGSDAARVSARRVLERLDRDWSTSEGAGPVMLCLVSATQSGSLAGHLQSIIESSELHLEPRFVSLFRLGPSALETLHDLSGDPRFELLAGAGATAQGTPVRIDPQVYFPLSFQDQHVVIDAATASKHREFFERYLGTGLIQVHRDHQEADGRPLHHAIHLATERLLGAPGFIDRFEARLRALETPPLLIVTPPHEPGRALAKHAHAYFERGGHSCPVFGHSSLQIAPEPQREEERALRDLLRGAAEHQSLLIIDDVCITGTRLCQYQRNIRNCRFSGRIDYLVGVARPNSSSVWSDHKRYLGHRDRRLPRHTLQAVDEVVLPDWRDDCCPWCIEKRMYQRWAKIAALPEPLIGRLETLSRSSDAGLEDELFLQRPGAAPFAVGPASLYLPEGASQPEVFAAIAAALQVLRTERSESRPLLGPRRFPVSTVLKHEDYCRAKWTDTIIRASLLRAAISDELVYADPQSEEARAVALGRLIMQPSEGEHEIALEILIAAGEEKCRLADTEELRDTLRADGFSEVSDYMLDRVAELEPA